MKLLLDTCTFLWMSTNEDSLSTIARSAITDPANRRFLSSISVMELAIKTKLRKLVLHAPLEQVVHEGMRRGVVEELPVAIEHSLAVARLPLLHRDPFDRLLIAQSQVEGMPLVTNDAAIRQYAVQIIW